MKMTQARKLQYAQQALAKERAMREKERMFPTIAICYAS